MSTALKAVNGLVIVAVLVKLLSGLTQIVLGWYLAPEEFALYAAAVSAQIVVAGLRDAGVGRILVQRGNYDELAGWCAWGVIILNVLAIGVVYACVPVFAGLYGEANLLSVVMPVVICLPLQSFSSIYQANLRLREKFGTLGRIELVTSVFQYLFSILLVLLGAGVYGLVYGAAVGLIVQFLVLNVASGGIRFPGRFTVGPIVGIITDCRWLIVGGFLTAFALRGDYFVLGLMDDKRLLGIYYFGFQMAFTISLFFGSALQTVFLARFSKSIREGASVRAELRGALGNVAIKTGLLAFFSSVFAPEAIEAVWGDKWSAAVPIFCAVALTTPLKMCLALMGVLVESAGMWGRRALMLAVDAGITMFASSFVLFDPNIKMLVIAVVASRVLGAGIQLYLVQRWLAIPILQIANKALAVQILFFAGWAATLFFPHSLVLIGKIVFVVILLLVLYRYGLFRADSAK